MPHTQQREQRESQKNRGVCIFFSSSPLFHGCVGILFLTQLDHLITRILVPYRYSFRPPAECASIDGTHVTLGYSLLPIIYFKTLRILEIFAEEFTVIVSLERQYQRHYDSFMES